MLVREIMERVSLPNFGLTRMYIEDALLEMSVQQAPWQKEISLSIVKDQRFYYFPKECIKVMDIMVQNHMNDKGQYRSIPRLLNEPLIKDTSKSEGAFNQYSKVSDLNKSINTLQESYDLANNNETLEISGAREYGYYIKGDKLAIVEKAVSSDPSADVINDMNAYQKSDNNWKTPTESNLGGVKIVYAYKPVWKPSRLGVGNDGVSTDYLAISDISPKNNTNTVSAASNFAATAGVEYVFSLATVTSANSATDSSGYTGIDVSDPATAKGKQWAAGKWIYLDNAGFFTGMWEIIKTGGDDSGTNLASKYQIGVRRPVEWNNGEVPETTMEILGVVPLIYIPEFNRVFLAVTNVSSIYTDNEDFDLPITDLQASSLICYIKSQIALESGNIELKLYYDKEFKRKLAQQETAYVSGPRMISSGPFALKR